MTKEALTTPMKIYKVECDVNTYQSLYPEDDDVYNSETLFFGGTPKASDWKPPKMYCDRPLLKRPDFWYIGPGVIVAGASAMDAVRTPFEMAGELLELPYDNEILTVLNVTECINALDHDASEWLMTADGQRAAPTRFAFHGNRIGESSLFKIPETRFAYVFCAEREADPEIEFKAAVEHHQLKGLVFEEVWSDE